VVHAVFAAFYVAQTDVSVLCVIVALCHTYPFDLFCVLVILFFCWLCFVHPGNPNVSSASPAFGPVGGATQVVLSGSGFPSVTDPNAYTVQFSNGSATVNTTAVYQTSTSIQLTTPVFAGGAMVYSVQVFPNGQQAAVGTVSFTAYGTW